MTETMYPVNYMGNKPVNPSYEEIDRLKAEKAELVEALKQLADDKGSAYWTPEETRQIAHAAIAKAERKEP